MEDTTKPESIQQTANPIKVKRKHTFLKFLIGTFIFILAIIFSFNMAFPGLLTTKDLGVRYSSADYDSASKKLSTIKELLVSLPNSTSSSYSTPVDIDVKLNSSEITAFINTNNPVSYAINNCQVLVNNDGNIEMSGSMNVDYFLNNIIAGKVTREQIVKEVPALSVIPASVNLYLKFTGEIMDNKSSIEIKDAAVQGITIPTKYVNTNEAVSTLTSGVDSFINKNNLITGTNIKSLTSSNGQVHLIGSIPSTITIRQ